MLQKRIQESLLIIMVFVISLSSADEDYKIIGEYKDGYVQLLWWMQEMPDNFEGFEIRKKYLNEKGSSISDPISITDGNIIKPGIFQREWKLTVKNEKKITYIDKYSQKMIDRIKKKEPDFSLISDLKDKKKFKCFRRGIKHDFNMALLSGFGAIDSWDTNNADAAEYSLYIYRKSMQDIEFKTSFIVYNNLQENISDLVDIKVEKMSNSAKIMWELPVETVDKYSLVSLLIKRSKDGEKDYLPIVKNGIPFGENEGEIYKGKFYDPNVEDRKEYDYQLEFKNYFDSTFIAGTESFTYHDASQYIPLAPNLISAEKEEQAIKIKWKFPQKDIANIRKFEVQKCILPGDEYFTIGEVLPYEDYTFNDTDTELYEGVLYRIVAVGLIGGNRSSNVLLKIGSNLPKPPPPQNFSISHVKQNNRDCISIKWKEQTKEEKEKNPLKGYFLYIDRYDEDEVDLVNSTPMKTNSYVYDIGGKDGRSFNVRLTAVSPEGVESQPVEDKVYIPNQKLPEVKLRRYKTNKDGSGITWLWRYPDNVKELKGFRLYQDDVLIADEYAINANSREYTVSGFAEGKSYKFQIQAVSGYGVESKKSKKKTYKHSSKGE